MTNLSNWQSISNGIQVFLGENKSDFKIYVGKQSFLIIKRI